MRKALLILLAVMMVLVTTSCTKDAEDEGSTASTTAAVSNVDYSKENWWDDAEWTEDFHLTFATTANPGSGSGIATAKAIELIKERSDGHLVIEQVFNGALGNESSTFAQCMEGSVDMTGASVGTVSMYVPHLEVFTLPFLIDSYEHEWAVMQSDEWKAIRQRTSDELEGVTIVSMTEFGMRGFGTVDKPITKLEDIKGMKIRTAGNPTIDHALQLVGANPVSVAYTDTYTALQNKVVDGEEINATSISMQKHYEIVKYFTEIGFYPYLSFALISNATLDRMPEHYGRLIMDTFAETDEYYMTEVIYDWDSSCTEDCLANGMEFVTVEDRDAWVEAMAPLYEETAAQDPMYAAFIDKALELRNNSTEAQ